MPIVAVPEPSPNLAGVCEAWATPADVSAAVRAKVDADLLVRCLEAASGVLYRLSGRQWPGSCLDAVRPGARTSGEETTVRWRNGWSSCGGCNQRARWGCGSVPEVPLPGNPVTTVVEVLVDGVALSPGSYRLDDGRWLVRLDGAWPCCQDMTAADDAVGAWLVTFRQGLGPPREGVIAAAELGGQLALGATPAAAGECKLPKRVQQLTRQGITAVVLDPMTFLDKGRTGLVDVDLFLASVNPAGITRPATAGRPEHGRRNRRTG